jgi:hypothetical protein
MRLSYELIDMILLKLANCQLAIILWRIYIAKKLIHTIDYVLTYPIMDTAIMNSNIKLAKFLHSIGHGHFNYCTIKWTENNELIRYVNSIVELSGNISECFHYYNLHYNSKSNTKPIPVILFALRCFGCRTLRYTT